MTKDKKAAAFLETYGKGELQIVVLQRGHVIIGRFHLDPESLMFVVFDSKTIRNWGTERGLGQLALDGPTRSTILEDEICTAGHYLTVIKTLNVNPDRWTKVF
jgi:hypothetical protein